eukprot:jgi/Phyca11/532613/estExt2_fgenesh1_pg.C_PHYCAscaffold_60159
MEAPLAYKLELRRLQNSSEESCLRTCGGARSQYDAYPGPERSLVDALNALEVNPLVNKSSLPKTNHVFLNILPQAIVDPQYLELDFHPIGDGGLVVASSLNNANHASGHDAVPGRLPLLQVAMSNTVYVNDFLDF